MNDAKRLFKASFIFYHKSFLIVFVKICS